MLAAAAAPASHPSSLRVPLPCAQVISKATVPLFKYEDVETGVKIDISFDVANGPEVTAAPTRPCPLPSLPPPLPCLPLPFPPCLLSPLSFSSLSFPPLSFSPPSPFLPSPFPSLPSPLPLRPRRDRSDCSPTIAIRPRPS